MSISALILTKNEEEMIEGCLKQLDFVDEIIILDQKSQDNTVKIAKRFTDSVYGSTEESFSKKREILASKAKGSWLLYIDADERLSPQLIKEIRDKIQSNTHQAFYFPRKNIILGKWLKHGGWSPDYVPRLFQKEKLKGWYGEVHESPKIVGDFGYLKNPLEHITGQSMEKMLTKTIKWAKIEAKLAYKADHPKVSSKKILWASAREFSSRYIVKFGFLDGYVGLIESIFQAIHKSIVLTYLWELQNNTESDLIKEKFKS